MGTKKKKKNRKLFRVRPELAKIEISELAVVKTEAVAIEDEVVAATVSRMRIVVQGRVLPVSLKNSRGNRLRKTQQRQDSQKMPMNNQKIQRRLVVSQQRNRVATAAADRVIVRKTPNRTRLKCRVMTQINRLQPRKLQL